MTAPPPPVVIPEPAEQMEPQGPHWSGRERKQKILLNPDQSESSYDACAILSQVRPHQYSISQEVLWTIRMILAMTKHSQQVYDYNYIYTLLMNTNFGVMDSFVPNVMEQCPSLMKSKTKDPDLSILHEALAGLYQDEFLETMRSEIGELENMELGLLWREASCQMELIFCQVPGPWGSSNSQMLEWGSSKSSFETLVTGKWKLRIT